MKKNVLLYMTLAILAIGCKKEAVTPFDPQSPESEENSTIKYVSTDGKLLTPVNIDKFESNYVASVYYPEEGYGLMFFDGPVTAIADHAFDGCDRLLGIELSSHINKIGDYAFADCTNLETVDFQHCRSSFKSIGKHAFSNCSKLADFEFVKSLELVDDCAFEGVGLREIRLTNPNMTKLSETFAGTNPPFMYIKVSTSLMEKYRDESGALSKYICGDVVDANGGNWTNFLPQGLNIRDLTIPGTHDSATWSCWWHTPIETVIKDQDLSYDETFNLGVRAFDLRIGNNDVINFFCHGNIGPLSRLNTFEQDQDEFPSMDKIKNSFLIMFVKDDYNSDTDNMLGCFSELMKNLIDKHGYDENCFIAFDPELTLADVKGKILLFVRTEEYLGYSKHDIPLNYITGDGIQVYRKGEPVPDKSYDVMWQDEYEMRNATSKCLTIEIWLENRQKDQQTSFFINQFNATEYESVYIPIIGKTIEGYYFSWPIIEGVNPYMHDKIDQSEPDQIYRQPLGVVFYDMCGVDNYSDEYFCGETLSYDLWRHNFSNYSVVSK